MKTQRTHVVAASLLGALTLLSVGCGKTADATGVPAPSTSVGTEIDDSVITTSVKTALLSDPNIKSFDLKVETRKGEVQLSGFVDNPGQIERALGITRAIEGVRQVNNEMSVKK